MNGLAVIRRSLWLYYMAVFVVTVSLVCSPFILLAPSLRAERNETATSELETGSGNITEALQVEPETSLAISDVQVIEITVNSATITWITNRPADSVVNYGNSASLGLSSSDATLVSSHSVCLMGLGPGATYFYEVQSTNETGNITATDNNGSLYYSFKTLVPETIPTEPQFPDTSELEPKKAVVLISPDKEVVLKSPSEKITLTIPSGAVAEQIRVELTEKTSWPSTGMKIVNLFELNAYAIDRADAKVNQFQKELQIVIKHDPEDLKGLNADSLRLFYLDETTRQWVFVPTSNYDNETKILTAAINHFSHYGEQAPPTISGPGRIMNYQANMHSGTAVTSYPIEVPFGRNGFQPKIDLIYNSGVADEMKNKQSVGSWVGIGWSLDLGNINYDEEKQQYFLTIDGQSYRLVKIANNPSQPTQPDAGSYRTEPDSFFTATYDQLNHAWWLFDKEGTRYDFTNALYHSNNVYYRWTPISIQDVHGNRIIVNYVTDTWFDRINWTQNVRSSYPTYIYYNYDQNNTLHAEIKFNSSYDCEDPDLGKLRNDNPKGIASTIPRVMENRKLDSVEIRVDGNLVRKYVFTYSTTSSYQTPDYPGLPVYYSGKHTLMSIAEVGADGVSQLPMTTFAYADLQIYCNDTSQSGYQGNPGNPASLYWPHLTSVSNGYGATVTFSYTQNPSPLVTNIWTREVVTSKAINPGIGPVQTYQYEYTGAPLYFEDNFHSGGKCWYSEYRGFSEVKETDAAGNYVKHYYWTTGSKEAEYLSGREYKTEWFDFSGALLNKVEYTWDYQYTTNNWVQMPWVNGRPSSDAVVDPAGFIYVASESDHCVYKLSDIYQKITQIGSRGTGDGQFERCRGVAVDNNGYIYVADTYNTRIQKFDSGGNFIKKWSCHGYPQDLAVGNNGDVYVVEANVDATLDYAVVRYNSSGNYLGEIFHATWNGYWCLHSVAVDTSGYVYVLYCCHGSTNGGWVYKLTSTGSYVSSHHENFKNARDITVDNTGCHWVVQDGDGGVIWKFDSAGNPILSFTVGKPEDASIALSTVAVLPTGEVVTYRSQYDTSKNGLLMFAHPYQVYLSEVKETVGDKTSRIRYLYDNYGNVVTEYRDGDLDTNSDDATIHRVFYPNTGANILGKPARERTYATITDDVGGVNLKAETLYYYDNLAWGQPPTKGALTRLEQKKDAGTSVSTYYTYDSYGNRLTETDPKNNTITFVYDTNKVLPIRKTYPTVNGITMQEFYTWDYGSGKITSETDFNGQTTTYEYDTFKRLVKVVKPGDSSASPTIQYQYNNWGTINQQHLKTLTKLAEGNYIWKSDYFDGIGRVIQTHAQGEMGYTVIAFTTTFNNRGLVDREYMSQVLASGSVNGYYTPAGDWKYTSYTYDGLSRITNQTSADGTTISHDFSTPWKDLVTNERGYKKAYYYDAFDRLVKVQELDASHALYSTTTYSYDVLNNLIQTVDNNGNTITMNYDWLSKKTSMSDPDMGSWSYGYDNNGNLITQTDAKVQTITFSYDALNRLTGKSYPAGLGMTNVTYTYDSTTGDNYGKGRRTGMTDALGSTAYKYDARSRLIEEKRTIDSVDYTTQYSYDPADRLATVTYPTGETVTQTYNGRGLPYSLSGSMAGNIVTSTLYNKLGQITEINLSNGVKTTFGYWDVGGSYDTTGGYYGRLWEIKTFEQPAGSPVLQDVKHTWDAGGNLIQREDTNGYIEDFGYDFLDRLTSASGVYPEGGGGEGAGLIEEPLSMSLLESTQGDTGWSNPSANAADTGGSGNGFETTPENAYADGNGDASNLIGKIKDDRHRYYNYNLSLPTCSTTEGIEVRLDWRVSSISSSPYMSAELSWDGGQSWTSIKNTATGSTLERTDILGGATDSWGHTWTLSELSNSNFRVRLTCQDGAKRATFYLDWVPVKVYYSLPSYTLDVTSTGCSAVIVEGLPGGNQTVPAREVRTFPDIVCGTVVTLTAEEGWACQFQEWSGDATGSANPVNVTMTSNKSVTAHSVEIPELKPYNESYSYNQIGNIITKNGTSYSYGFKPHAVTAVGTTNYSYDANGNMISRGNQTITWDVENRPVSITYGVNTTTFVYDGDGSRVKKTEGGQTIIYIGRYYEKNITTGNVTTYYYLGDRLVALRNGADLRYVHEDHLTGTSVVSDTLGNLVGSIKYYPYGMTRSSIGSLYTDKKFTGQRLDATGLYYYGARYYDPSIGRFISADTVGPNPNNPQSYNRYAYCFNNPLAYTDPTGNWGFSNICKWVKDNVIIPLKETAVDVAKTAQSAATLLSDPSLEHAQAFGMNLGNVALGHGTVEAIATAIETGDVKGAVLNISTGAVSFASNFVTPGAGRVVGSVVGKSIVRRGFVDTAENVVYRSVDEVTKKVSYVGITKNFERRAAEEFAEKGIKIRPIQGLFNLSRADARAVEQALIEFYGLQSKGGTLLNKINSISRLNPIYDESIQRGIDLLRNAGYSGF